MTLKKLYTISVILSPLLMLYKSPVGFMDFGTFFIILTIILNICSLHNQLNICFPNEWILYILYIIVGTGIALLITFNYVVVIALIPRIAKNILYVLILLTSYKNNIFDIALGKKLYKILVLISTFYIYVQTFAAKIMNTIFWGYIPGLVWKKSYVQDILLTDPRAFRPSSFFYEPSHYFIFVFLALVLYMFEKKKCGIYKLFSAIFISGGIVLSASSMGILFVALIWLYWIIWQLFSNRFGDRTELIFIVICFLGLITASLLLRIPWIVNALTRVFDLGYTGGNAIIGRGMGYYEITQMPLANLIFGYGYGNVGNNYYPSLVFNFLSMGIIGIVFTFYIYFKIYHRCQSGVPKLAFMIYIALCFYSEIFMSLYLLFFMSFFMNKMIHPFSSKFMKGRQI